MKTFVERTGCDMLAVSIGNVHGLDDIPRIDIPLLKRIAEVSPVPLVIHGGSGIARRYYAVSLIIASLK